MSSDCYGELQAKNFDFVPIGGFDEPGCTVIKPRKLYSTPTAAMNKPAILSRAFAQKVGAKTEGVNMKEICLDRVVLFSIKSNCVSDRIKNV